MTLEEIREDLKEVRYYYTRKQAFDEAGRAVGRKGWNSAAACPIRIAQSI